ncbi:hypothetical protein [Mycobacterium nebraskense]|uniref:Uncharacterized protein n=1 Tax=Mycobacterium nebraskense TaxID=244292 RepID=A0A0F5NJY3_9MYCO|nr:hypothetical protein [Mycobacterium nebraskense]KKC06543.1 hypothetical protein WU83_02475 [Mycobacterium nebraskense]KLO40212.1 hypothetical protein ABW17_17545 [Mycobacterium nebraskense]MBI2692919.1 hypothetical protein [Mycobacterium nebraskense]MCV7117653.1 hypothetical protein [Mycobacterium nebraskense]ORW16915.1 hypothetical protein AWC17_14285 [Mycobacterium nebraskense]
MDEPHEHTLPAPVAEALERMYMRFAGNPFPRNVMVCPRCGPEWSTEGIASTSPRALSGRQLDALHVVSLDDTALRHFFPRLVELLLLEPAPPFDFVSGLHRLKGRLPKWDATDSSVLRQALDAVWFELLNTYPAPLGYLSDVRSALNFADWCDIPLGPMLDYWSSTYAPSATMHVADLISEIFMFDKPFEPPTKALILSWLSQPAVGDRLQDAFLATDSDQAASQLSTAHEIWAACIRA